MLKNCVIWNYKVTVLKAQGKRTLADVNCHCKMQSVMALDGVTSFWSLKDITNTCKRRQTVQLLQDSINAMAESWKKLKTSNVFSSFIVCSNQNRSVLVCEMMSNNFLFVGQLYEDKSLTLQACDLIFILYNWPPNSKFLLLTIHC